MKAKYRNKHLLATITVVGFAFTAPAALAAPLTWDTVAGDGTDITAGSGTWSTSSTGWNDAGTDVPWSQIATNDGSNTATFAGTDGAVDAYEVALGEEIATESLTFSSSGYKITGSTLALIAIPTVTPTLGTNGAITVAASKTATINSILRYDHNRPATITLNSGSVLNLGGGASGSNRPQWTFSGAGTVNLTAGAFAQSIGSMNNASINLTGGSHTMTDQSTTATTNIGTNIGSNAGRDVAYTVSGTGTLNVVASSNTSVAYTLHVGRNMGNFKSSLILQSGGTVNVGVTASRAGQINLGSVDGNSNSLLDVQGGTLTVGTGKTSNKLFFFAAGANAGKTATMTQSGGTSTLNGIQFGANTGDNVAGLIGANAYDVTALASLQVSGGNLYVGAQGITRGTAAAALPISIKLQGGTLGASQNWASSLDMKLTAATIRAQDSGSTARNITLYGALSNDDAVTGALTKTGSGTLTLAGANTYTGATNVNLGTLLVNAPGSLDPTSAVTVAAGAAFGGSGTVNGTVNVVAGGQLVPGGSGTIGTLTLANNSATSLALNGNTLSFDLPSSGTTCDLIDITGVSGTLALDGTNTILLNAPGGTVPAGTYTLMTYASKTGSGTLTLQNGTTSFANAELTVGETAVTLTVGAGGLTGVGIVWAGDLSGVWDGGILNWIKNGSPSQAYVDGDVVVFDDSGSDAAVISSGAAVSPSAVYFNNTNKNYTVSAVMAGAMTLNKSGFGATTLTGANTFTGTTTISSGTLKLSGSGRLSTTGTSNVYASAISLGAGATFEHAGATQTLSGAITGGGNVVLNGAASGLILSGTGSSYGSLTMNSIVTTGRVFIGNTGALPAAATVAINGGTFVIDAAGTYNSPITAASGVGITARKATTLTNVTLPGSGSVIFNNDDASTLGLTISNGQTLTGALTVQVGGEKMLTSTAALGAATLSGKLTGNGSLVVTSGGNIDNTTLFGTGVLTLTGPNDYTGDTTVNSGVLAVNGTSLPDAGKLVINGLGKVNLTNTETVSALDFDGTPQPSGDYSASSVPVGANITTSSFTGSGTLTVGGAPANNFASWAALQAPPVTEGPNGDDDKDGVKNLVEYALADGQERGTLTGTSLSFAKRGGLYGGDLTYEIETSDNLGISDDWSTVTPTVNDDSTISYTLQNPGDNFARLKVTQTTP